MSNIQFIDTVKNKVAARVKQIDDKKQTIIIQTDKLKEKEKQITATELLYKSNFEERYYSQLVQQKKDKEQIVYIIDVLEDQLNLMGIPVVQLDNEEVKKQIITYVEETHLKEAIEEVNKYKVLYLEKINNYLQTIDQMVETREDINSIGEYMTPETKAVIVPALQICHEDMKKYNQTQFAVGGQWELFDMTTNNNLGIELKAKSEIISSRVGTIWGRTI